MYFAVKTIKNNENYLCKDVYSHLDFLLTNYLRVYYFEKNCELSRKKMKRIYRSKDDVKICEICAGVAKTFDLDPSSAKNVFYRQTLCASFLNTQH
jgi:hypothetical protein